MLLLPYIEIKTFAQQKKKVRKKSDLCKANIILSEKFFLITQNI